MVMRLQELHPSSVHYPIALLPVSLAADALGLLTRSRSLLEVGRLTMPVAAASAALAGVFGLIAQEVVQTDDEAAEMLATHRTLNLGLIGLAGAMAVKRVGVKKPGLGYLAVGAAGLGAMIYSAYLGGQMVYDRGVGVRKAGGLREEVAPPLTHPREAAAMSARHIAQGARHAAEDTLSGQLVPTLVPDRVPASSDS
jgi:uncharacterized membrane protein